MSNVFLSYSRNDKFFAELLRLKLVQAGIEVWQDGESILAGEEWQNAIDLGIYNCKLMVVVLSQKSTESHHVTYEWARAMALDKAILPIKIEDCKRHSKLGRVQEIDLSRPNEVSWQQLISRVKSTLKDHDQDERGAKSVPIPNKHKSGEEKLSASIEAYLNDRGFRLLSLERIQKKFDLNLNENEFNTFVDQSDRFARATLKGKRPGLKLI